MSAIRDSDNIPTNDDKDNADEMFRDSNGEINMDKVIHAVSRQNRVQKENDVMIGDLHQKVAHVDFQMGAMSEGFREHRDQFEAHQKEFKEHRSELTACLQGDPMGMYPGLIKDTQQNTAILNEVYEKITGKDATTHKKKNPEVSEENKYLWMIVGGIIIGAFLLTLWASLT